MKLKVCIVIILSWLNSVPEHNRDVCAYQTHTEHILFIRYAFPFRTVSLLTEHNKH